MIENRRMICMTGLALLALLAIAALGLMSEHAHAAEPEPPTLEPVLEPTPGSVLTNESASEAEQSPAPANEPAARSLEYMVPELEDQPYGLQSGPRPFLKRLSFSPGYGKLGNDRLYQFRLAFNPNSWLGWEGTVGHSPGETVHALLNTINAVVRYPLPWRIQPFVNGGYGMIMVFPGEALRADPVTKNVLAFGGGLEAYIRDDVALRFDLRSATVIGDKNDEGTVAYQYREATLGFAFYRELK